MTDIQKHPPADRLEADIRAALDRELCAEQPGDAELLARVKDKVMAAVAQSAGELHRTVRADAGGWEPVAQGVERKFLWQSGDALSCLMRLAPGAVVAGHMHAIDEECVVLEGSLRIGTDLLLRAGDFHVGVKGVPHADASTETGALVYLRGARPEHVS